jgi:hypothetical protein
VSSQSMNINSSSTGIYCRDHDKIQQLTLPQNIRQGHTFVERDLLFDEVQIDGVEGQEDIE